MKKILIVDDEQDIVESLKFVLENYDYTCYCAYNGEDGLKLAREIIPDLIILDVMMPRINGFKISRLLKFDEKYLQISGPCCSRLSFFKSLFELYSIQIIPICGIYNKI